MVLRGRPRGRAGHRRSTHHKKGLTRTGSAPFWFAVFCLVGVPAELLAYLAGLLGAERRLRRTPVGSRKLTPRQQAVLALRWFRDRTRIEAPGRDHGVSRATACRYVAEAVDVLSAQAPGLDEAVERALAEITRAALVLTQFEHKYLR